MADYQKEVLEVLASMDNEGLNVKNIDVDRSLLEQGLDSLDMMDLYFKLEEKFDKKIEFDDEITQHAQWTSVTDIANGLQKL